MHQIQLAVTQMFDCVTEVLGKDLPSRRSCTALEDGIIAGRIAALLVGDVEACGADVLDGGAHDAMVWPARPLGMCSSGKWCRMRLR
jgi:hypothetical protein